MCTWWTRNIWMFPSVFSKSTWCMRNVWMFPSVFRKCWKNLRKELIKMSVWITSPSLMLVTGIFSLSFFSFIFSFKKKEVCYDCLTRFHLILKIKVYKWLMNNDHEWVINTPNDDELSKLFVRMSPWIQVRTWTLKLRSVGGMLKGIAKEEAPGVPLIVLNEIKDILPGAVNLWLLVIKNPHMKLAKTQPWVLPFWPSHEHVWQKCIIYV